MKKERQLPLSFNNDRDVKAIRNYIKDLSTQDLKLFSNALDNEFTGRQYSKTFRKENSKEAMAGFLDKISFDFFCTFTTRKPVSLFATRRIADKVCDYIQAGTNTSMFWAAEEFDVRDGFHFHALMKLDTTYNKYDVFNWYFQKYGRCDLIDNREPDRQLAASYYVSKYVTKRITDYDFRISKYHMR